MKTAILLFGLILNCTCQLSGQEWKEIEKGVSKVIVQSDKDLNGIAKTLLSGGYSIAQKDMDVGYILTDWKEIKTNSSVRVQIVSEAGKLIITGKLRADFLGEAMGANAGNTESKITKYGQKGSPAYWSFMELVSVAKLFGEDLSFEF